MAGFDPSSRSRLTARDLGRFPSDNLFDRIGRAVCAAGCLPRKELFEAWEVARRVRRLFRGGRIVDLGGGHGLVALLLVLLDDSSPNAVVIDTAIPASAAKVHRALVDAWPRLDGRVTFVADDIRRASLESSDVVVSIHACGALTDVVLERAVSAGARVAVLPCCHDLDLGGFSGLEGWLDKPLAIDVLRALHVRARGYRTWTQVIPGAITPKNRLLLAAPDAAAAPDEAGGQRQPS